MQAVIDRIEEDKAVLLVGEEEKKVIFPLTYLPEGVGEGDYLKLEICPDPEATKNAREEAAELLKSLNEQE